MKYVITAVVCGITLAVLLLAVNCSHEYRRLEQRKLHIRSPEQVAQALTHFVQDQRKLPKSLEEAFAGMTPYYVYHPWAYKRVELANYTYAVAIGFTSNETVSPDHKEIIRAIESGHVITRNPMHTIVVCALRRDSEFRSE